MNYFHSNKSLQGCSPASSDRAFPAAEFDYSLVLVPPISSESGRMWFHKTFGSLMWSHPKPSVTGAQYSKSKNLLPFRWKRCLWFFNRLLSLFKVMWLIFGVEACIESGLTSNVSFNVSLWLWSGKHSPLVRFHTETFNYARKRFEGPWNGGLMATMSL